MVRSSVIPTEALLEYVHRHSASLDGVAVSLQEETARLGDIARMQIATEEALLLRMLVRISNAKQVLEIGTFTGFSALMMARGGAERVICLDVSEEWSSIARRYWRDAGLDDVIELRLGQAEASLRAMPQSEIFDFVFIDADKPSYPVYYELAMGRLRPGGLIAVDNTLWSGQVADETDRSENTESIRRFNSLVSTDERVEVVIIPISDGLTLLWKKP